jgi:glutathione S-transferase
MKLYYSPGACSLSPHIVLHESGLPFEAEKVDLATRKTAKGKDFTRVNPKGYVPALVTDDGDVITEGAAIVQYIADRVPRKKLAPKNGTIERTRLHEWLNFIATEVHKGMSPLWSDKTPKDYAEGVKERLAGRFETLEKHFRKNAFLMGEEFSVADAYLFTVLNWPKYLGIDMSKFKNIGKYMQRVGARPGVQSALKAEGLVK